jgi:hypothetical protein
MKLYQWEAGSGDWDYILVTVVAENVEQARLLAIKKYQEEYLCDPPFELDESFTESELPCVLFHSVEIN